MVNLLLLISIFLFTSLASANGLKAHLSEHLFDIKGSSQYPLSLPTDVVVDSSSNIFVLDGENNMVQAFNSEGDFLFIFGSKGNSKASFDTPVGIGIDKSDKIYICDTTNSRIVIFDNKGKYQREILLEYEQQGMLASRPVDITIDDKRDLLFITDGHNHSVLVYTKRGDFIRMWGERGGDPGQFRHPGTMAENGEKLFIADVLGTRVQIIDINAGEFAGQIGKWGVLPGELFRPKGVAVDSSGLVYVADSYMDVIQVFDEYGEFLHILGDNENQIRRFISPAAIFIDKKKRLYVAEVLLNKIGVYSIK